MKASPSPLTSQKETPFGSNEAPCALKLCVSQGEGNGRTVSKDASGSCEDRQSYLLLTGKDQAWGCEKQTLSSAHSALSS